MNASAEWEALGLFVCVLAIMSFLFVSIVAALSLWMRPGRPTRRRRYYDD